MANPFDREIINPLERPLSGDINLVGTYSDYQLRQMLAQIYRTGVVSGNTAAPVYGFINDGFQVIPSTVADGKVHLRPGIAFAANTPVSNISSISGLNDIADIAPIVLSPLADEVVNGITVPDAGIGAGNARIDLIEVRVNRTLTDPTSRDVWDTGTQQFAPDVVNKTLKYTVDGTVAVVATADVSTTAAIKWKKGAVTVTNDPTACPTPTSTTGYLPIAHVFVDGDAATYTAFNIRDIRPYLLQDGLTYVSCLYEAFKTAGVKKVVTSQSVAPPGVILTGYYEASPNQGIHPIIIIGDSLYTAAVQVSGAGASSGGGDPHAAYWPVPPIAMVPYNISVAESAILADSTQVSPVYGICPGQPFLTGNPAYGQNGLISGYILTNTLISISANGDGFRTWFSAILKKTP